MRLLGTPGRVGSAPLRRVLALVPAALLPIGLAAVPGVARADTVPPAVTQLSLAAPTVSPAMDPMTLGATLTDDNGPVVGQVVSFARRETTGETVLGTATTDEQGAASLVVPTELGDATYEASFAGDAREAAASSNDVTTTGVRLATTLRVTGPRSVVDGDAATLHLSWTGPAGRPVAGAVELYERQGGGGVWQPMRKVELGRSGRGTVTVRPRVTTAFRASGAAAQWWRAATSAATTITNRPPVAPVILPRGAPRPQGLPAQPRAFAPGPRVTIQPVPQAVWNDMTGKTWHVGCPVGRDGLRLIHVSYWGYDGYAHRGELVVAARVASNFAGAFAALYRGRFPVRAMYRVDRFGWSDRAHGGNDFAAMGHGDTSAFDCRWVDGRPGVTSPHAYGTALDLNTWENPYRSPQGYLPDSWWMGHADPRYAWRSRSAPVVRLLARYGFRWTYGLGDTQHFDVG